MVQVHVLYRQHFTKHNMGAEKKNITLVTYLSHSLSCRATVVVQRLLIQEGISAPIICRNPTITPRPTPTLPPLTITTTTTTTTPEPTPPSGGCRFTSLTNIPIGGPSLNNQWFRLSNFRFIVFTEYTTSFENRDNPFRGWNVISSGSYRWTAQSGPTPSAFTGPSQADDGKSLGINYD